MPAADGANRHARLADARLYLIATLGPPTADELAPIRAALGSGAIDMLQVRDVSKNDALLQSRARALRALCAEHGVLCLLNDRPDLAAALDLDGAHVGRGDVPAATARAWLGPARLLGLSTHDPDEVAAALDAPVDHIGLGPCFPTASKTLAYDPGGPALLTRCLPAAGVLPVFPIAGIDADNLPALVAAGARRAAIGRGILGARDPAAAARTLRAMLPSA